jgi:flagellar motor switch protein FliM
VSEILSGEELRALLDMVGAAGKEAEAAAPFGRAQKRSVVPYDFRRHMPLGKEDLAAIERSLERIPRLLAPALGRLFRAPVAIAAPTVDQVLARPLFESFAAPSLLYVLDLAPIEAPGAFSIAPELLAKAIDRMLGGSGASAPLLREPTAAEAALARRFAETALDAFKKVLPLAFRIARQETDPRCFRAIPPDDPVLACEIELEGGPVAGSLRLVVPAAPLAEKRKSILFCEATKPALPAETGRKIEAGSSIAELPLEAAAVLGETEISIGTLLGLEVGDVLPLGRRTSEPLEIHIQGVKKLCARPGRRGERLAVKIVADR